METPAKTVSLPFSLALGLAAAAGFIALAYEILWARLMNFSSGSSAQAFAAMLGSYLFGLALGALLSQRWQHSATGERMVAHGRILARLIAASNLVGFLIVPLASWLILSQHWVRVIPLIMMGAALLGTILPLLCHLAIAADNRVGARMSYIYLANIIGSAAGSLITGFLLMDWLKLWQIAAALLLFGVLVSAALACLLKAVRLTDVALWLVGTGLACASPLLHDELYERLQLRADYRSGNRFAMVVESKHGVITVATNHFVYGNAVYDGVIETRLKPNSGLLRPYFISALHPEPKEVLVIGVSAGAWTQIFANHSQVEKVTAVEISHGYLEVMRRYPEVAGVLTHPKVEIHIDDGRRWLRRNPERHFDVIVMNTSYYWREFASALLSREFLELTRDHLKPGGFVMWNCTESPRAVRTGLEVFPHTMMVGNNCVGSLTPLVPNRERWAATLRAYRIEGRPLFDLATPEGRQDFDGVLAFFDSPPESRLLMRRPEMERAFGNARVITDDNLGDEYPVSLTTFLRSLVPGL